MKTEEKDFTGLDIRLCGEHRTVGSHRAWCHDCTTWCYPESPCPGCQIPKLESANIDLEAEIKWLRERHAEAVAQLPATIEVLEAFDCLDLDDRVIEWYENQAKPHLEHLKALAKEAEV